MKAGPLQQFASTEASGLPPLTKQDAAAAGREAGALELVGL